MESGIGLRLRAMLEPVIATLGYDLVGIEYLPQGKHSLLRVYIDSEAGITVDDCAKVSHQVSGLLDVEDPIKGHYTLEVSSPGLDRPLFTPEHYRQFSGNLIKVKLTVPQNGRRNFKGMLKGVQNEQVLLEMDGEQILLPFKDIEKAQIVSNL